MYSNESNKNMRGEGLISLYGIFNSLFKIRKGSCAFIGGRLYERTERTPPSDYDSYDQYSQ